MEVDNREYVGRGLDILLESLRPYVQERFKARYAARWWDDAVEPVVRHSRTPANALPASATPEDRFTKLDLQALFNIMWGVWPDAFQSTLGYKGRNLTSAVHESRNLWAHQQSLDFDVAYDALSQIANLLQLLAAKDQEQEIRRLQSEMRGIQVKKETRGIDVERHSIISPAPYQLLAPPGDFTGRTLELAHLVDVLESANGVIVSGMGGMGKTTLALKLAEHIAPKYRDAQITLDLKGDSSEPLSVSKAMAHVIKTLKPRVNLPAELPALSNLYRSSFVKKPKTGDALPKRVLLLMDNAVDKEQVAQLVPPSGSIVIVTSRQHFVLSGFKTLDLFSWPIDDAIKFLIEIAPRVKSDQAEEIATICGNLPLALRLVGGALAERLDLRVEDYIARLGNLAERVDLIDLVLTASYDLLNASLQERWRVLSVFSSSFDTQAARGVWQIDATQADDWLGQLLRRNMIEFDEPTRRYKLHDLARDFATSRLSANERSEARRKHAGYYLTSAIDATVQLYHGDAEELAQRGVDLFEWDWSNYLAAWAWASERAESDILVARLCYRYLDVGWPLVTQRQSASEWIDWLEPALADAKQVDDERAQAVRSYHLAQAYAASDNDAQAIELYENALQLSQSVDTPSASSIIALALSKVLAKNLAGVARDICSVVLSRYGGEYTSPVKVVWELEDVREKVIVPETWILFLDADRTVERGRLREIDVADLRQRSRRAAQQGRRVVNYLAEAVADFHKSNDGWNELDALVLLSEVYADLGELESAIEVAQHALDLAKEIDPDRVGEIEWSILDGCCTGLGHHFLYVGEPRKALESYEKFLALFKDHENYMELDVLEGMAQAYLALGEPNKASACISDRGAFLSDVVNEDWAVNDAMYWRFGAKCEQAGFLEYAIDMMQRCLDWELESEHQEALAHLWHLALVYEKAGQLEQAIDRMAECVELEIEADRLEAGEHVAYLESLRIQWASQQRGQQ